mmetsp:Transcript_131900/g.367719  ORF Transcript_131900/g.367719 Transcript_131900/m.367719 type:complete len:200 (+) Transcript_131900:1458-2057(+)
MLDGPAPGPTFALGYAPLIATDRPGIVKGFAAAAVLNAGPVRDPVWKHHTCSRQSVNDKFGVQRLEPGTEVVALGDQDALMVACVWEVAAWHPLTLRRVVLVAIHAARAPLAASGRALVAIAASCPTSTPALVRSWPKHLGQLHERCLPHGADVGHRRGSRRRWRCASAKVPLARPDDGRCQAGQHQQQPRRRSGEAPR